MPCDMVVKKKILRKIGIGGPLKAVTKKKMKLGKNFQIYFSHKTDIKMDL